MPFTAEERERYRSDGYVLVRGLIDSGVLERLDARFLALVANQVPAPEGLVIMRDVAFAKRDAVLDGFQIAQAGTYQGAQRWRLIPVGQGTGESR